MKFTKTVRGGWRFTVEGRDFEAIRNIAGFAHRDWDVLTVEDPDRYIADQLASRGECVEAARGWSELNPVRV